MEMLRSNSSEFNDRAHSKPPAHWAGGGDMLRRVKCVCRAKITMLKGVTDAWAPRRSPTGMDRRDTARPPQARASQVLLKPNSFDSQRYPHRRDQHPRQWAFSSARMEISSFRGGPGATFFAAPPAMTETEILEDWLRCCLRRWEKKVAYAVDCVSDYRLTPWLKKNRQCSLDLCS